MTDHEQRCIVDLGDIHDSHAALHSVRRLTDEAVGATIESYLKLTGVLLNRRNPRGWFMWLDFPINSIFVTRCSDPPAPRAPDNKWQPWRYFVEAEMHEESRQATATAFYHEDFLNQS